MSNQKRSNLVWIAEVMQIRFVDNQIVLFEETWFQMGYSRQSILCMNDIFSILMFSTVNYLRFHLTQVSLRTMDEGRLIRNHSLWRDLYSLIMLVSLVTLTNFLVIQDVLFIGSLTLKKSITQNVMKQYRHQYSVAYVFPCEQSTIDQFYAPLHLTVITNHLSKCRIVVRLTSCILMLTCNVDWAIKAVPRIK